MSKKAPFLIKRPFSKMTCLNHMSHFTYLAPSLTFHNFLIFHFFASYMFACFSFLNLVFSLFSLIKKKHLVSPSRLSSNSDFISFKNSKISLFTYFVILTHWLLLLK